MISMLLSVFLFPNSLAKNSYFHMIYILFWKSLPLLENHWITDNHLSASFKVLGSHRGLAMTLNSEIGNFSVGHCMILKSLTENTDWIVLCAKMPMSKSIGWKFLNPLTPITSLIFQQYDNISTMILSTTRPA